MKKILILLIGLLMISVAGYSQETEIKGPKAKNTKPWKKNRKKKAIVLFGGKKDKTVGPKAKNEKKLKAESQDAITQPGVVQPSKKERKVGPKEKNKKPGRN